MSCLIYPRFVHAASAVLLTFSCCAVGVGQESASDRVRSAEIPGLIQDLGSAVFRERTSAVARLKNAGDAAIEPLNAALADAPVDQKVLISKILNELEKNSFAARMKNLGEKPALADVSGLPEWDRFAVLIGSDELSIRRYVGLVEAELELFAEAAKQSRRLPDLIRERATALLQSTQPSPVAVEEFSVDSYAALLLLAGNQSIRLPGQTSTSLSTLLNHGEFRNAVQSADGQWYLRLAGSYIQRGRISVIGPLNFARQHKMPEGLTLARDVLQNSLRGQNGLYAMVAVRELGSEDDLPLLESLFENRGEIFVPKSSTDQPVQYSVYNCDLALAVSLYLRNRDPRDFGFPNVDERSVPFRFAMDTVGFRSETDREKAFALYQEAFAD